MEEYSEHYITLSYISSIITSFRQFIFGTLAIALFVSFLINLFVLAVFAAEFSDPAHRELASLHNAGIWLSEKYGLGVKIIWGIGILSAGQSSTMTGTYAGQFVMEGFMNIKWAKWKRVLLTRSIAMVPTIIVALIATNDLDMMNNWLNVLQSVQLPFALLPILHFTSSETIMKEFKNGRIMKITVWSLAVLIMGINFYLVVIFVGSGDKWWIYLIVVLIIVVYLSYVGYLAIGPHMVLRLKMRIGSRFNLDTTNTEAEIERREKLKHTRPE